MKPIHIQTLREKLTDVVFKFSNSLEMTFATLNRFNIHKLIITVETKRRSSLYIYSQFFVVVVFVFVHNANDK
jgi:hypothetical protein